MLDAGFVFCFLLFIFAVIKYSDKKILDQRRSQFVHIIPGDSPLV